MEESVPPDVELPDNALPIKKMDNPRIRKIITKMKRRRNKMIFRFLIFACLFGSVGGLDI